MRQPGERRQCPVDNAAGSRCSELGDEPNAAGVMVRGILRDELAHVIRVTQRTCACTIDNFDATDRFGEKEWNVPRASNSVAFYIEQWLNADGEPALATCYGFARKAGAKVRSKV